jgi:uncharacterized YceG family protein
VSGGYGSGGYPGQGYGAPEYEGEQGRAKPRRQGGGRPQRDGQPGHPDQGYPAQGYPGQGYDGQGYGDPGYDTRGYPPDGGYQGTGPRRPQGGYDQPHAYDHPRGNGYDNWDQEQGDSSFLPGFGGPGPGPGPGQERDPRYDYDDGRGRGRRGGQSTAPGARGPGARGLGDGGPAAPGPDPRDWGNDPRHRDARNAPDGRYARDDWDDSDRPRKRATRWLPRALVLTVVVAIVAGGLVGGLFIYHKYQARYHPADYAGPGTGDVTVQVMSGDTAFSLAPRLLALGVIASDRAFTNAAESATSTTSTSSNGLQAGYYQLHEHMQASLAFAALTNPKNVVQTTVTIPEGKRAVDVIAIIAQKTKIPLKNFQQVLAHPSQLGLPSYAGGKVEGYLFPATYAIVPHETALQILQAMVQRFNVEAQQLNLVAAAKAVNLQPSQLIIEASLAQAEGGAVSDYPKIAEVINNRIAKGMHLQFDSTVLYGLGKYAVSATFKEINTPGPYNTYLNAGLPAGPISNPGASAIHGILQPDQGNWLYFLTKPGGKSEFSATPLKGQ